MKFKIILLIIILAILGGAFYWFQWRPNEIRKECYSLADKEKQQALNWDNAVVMSGHQLTQRADYDKIFNDSYRECLLKHGLEK